MRQHGASVEGDHISRRCGVCGKAAPETPSDHTLISANFGWRLSRSVAADGTVLLMWRCSECWAKFKQSRTQ